MVAAAAAVVVGREGGCEEGDMVSDTRLVRRRTLERRKYGGEGKVRGLESRRREGGAVVGSTKENRKGRHR